MTAVILRGYHPQQISGKINYINYIFRDQKTVSLFHKLNPLNLLHPKATYLLKGLDLYLLYWPEVLVYLAWAKYFRKVEKVVIDSQENMFLVGLVRWLGFNSELILYDFAEPNTKIMPKTSKRLARFDHIVVMTHAIKAAVVVQVPSLEKQIEVKHYKVQKDLFYPFSVTEAREKSQSYGIDYKFLLYVGSEQDRKNFFTLLEAFRQLQDQFPDLYLVKIGQSQSVKNRARLMRLLEQDPKLKHRFVLVEECSDDQLATYYNLAEVFVFPSLYEGFGIPLVEAMACGAPVVANNIPTTQEICGDAAIYPDNNAKSFAKAIKSLLSDQKQKAAQSAKCLKRAREYIY